MDSIHAFILGVVQAVTEFLPISSSGHLLAAHDILGFDMADSLRFDAALHLGTLLALFAFFWRDVVAMVKGFFRSLRHWDVRNDPDQRLVWMVIAGAIPAGIVGLVAESWIETNTRNLWLVCATLIIGAAAFWIVEAWARKQPQTSNITLRSAIVIGLAQVIALIPGISRSGATLVAGLGRKLDRVTAARYAFLVSLPVVTGAGVMKLTDIASGSPAPGELRDVAIGIATSAILGYVVIRFLLRFVQHHSLSAFAWYRVVAAVAIGIYLVVR
jgi:undecaprenyl-diphosphatase